MKKLKTVSFSFLHNFNKMKALQEKVGFTLFLLQKVNIQSYRNLIKTEDATMEAHV